MQLDGMSGIEEEHVALGKVAVLDGSWFDRGTTWNSSVTVEQRGFLQSSVAAVAAAQ